MCLVAAARVRARAKGVVFDLDSQAIDDLQRVIDRGICELSGLPFVLDGPRSAFSPSLDRIDPALGYVACNVRIVLHALNAALGDWGEDVFGKIAEAFVNARRSRRNSSKP